MTIVAVIQARMGSQRLPGKVLEPIRGRAMLLHVAERARATPGVDEVMIATTTDPRDDEIVSKCRGAGIRWVRGSEQDVLERYVLAAQATSATVVMRLTSDCPLLDPAVAGLVLQRFRETPGCAYASNVHPASWFDGSDVEVMTTEALRVAHRQAILPADREHVTPYLVRHPGRFPSLNVVGPEPWAGLKLSVDTAEDLDRVRRVAARLPTPQSYGWLDTVAAYRLAFPTPLEERARALFGGKTVSHRREKTAALCAAYIAGAESAGAAAGRPNPYSSEQGPLQAAWAMGWEDIAELGHRELLAGRST